MPSGYTKDGKPYKHGFKKGHPFHEGGKKGWFKKGKHISPKTEFKKGRKMFGYLAPGWKGGKCKNIQGYVLIHIHNHPSANGRDYVLEHRLVMEKILGRYLKPFEGVHHKNGIKDDNRPKNLILFVSNKNWHPCLCPKCGFRFLIK